jgi:hypothetical protein
MGVIYIVAIQNDDIKVPTHHFVEQLQQKWPIAKFHFISDPSIHSELQWSLYMDDEQFMLGDFSQRGISFKGGGLVNVAKLALWYRSLVPHEYEVLLYKDSLNHRPIALTTGTTVEDVINGFDIPFDLFPED